MSYMYTVQVVGTTVQVGKGTVLVDDTTVLPFIALRPLRDEGDKETFTEF